MSRETKTVKLDQLQALIEAGAILDAFIIEDQDGRFHVLCRSVKGVDHRIETKRGELRSFKTLDTAARLLRDLGISKMRLHMCEFAPGNTPLLR
ncbi:hypothetical protein [uncultured Halomonas sp.]|uniref:hypothetical protein n=1 Tax=uncultured Halomonas sp. TaxID=173971 RepID=UPI002626E239|nr:hypothetical protein [uncultured Halomonas sp.]